MTLSAVQICNLALDELPAKQIVSLTDNTKSAEVCRRHFTQALEELMEMGEWGFATKRERLTAIPNDREGYWSNAYAMPNDLGFPLRVLPFDQAIGVFKNTSVEFDVEGSTIWAPMDGVVLEYVTLTPEFAKMRPMFRKALIATLASRLLMPILRDASRKNALLQEAEVWRERAQARDLAANATQNTYGDNFIPSALGGYFTAPE